MSSEVKQIPAAETSNNSQEVAVANISLDSITEGKNARDIPATKFVDDIELFANSFTPPASPTLLIGAYRYDSWLFV